ncbi:MAG: aldo/keto reductase [Planctomycetota bacterium]|jgi:aryl-alcohol dehydrogenase-like predicted oxidoreductase
MMLMRELGYTGVKLTTVGLGTWAMGGGGWQYGWGPQDDNDAVAAVLAGLDNGINWIDTAAVYGLGHSEELVGKALMQTSHEPFIATKCGLLWDEKGQIIYCLEGKSIRQECDASLKRLGVDVIDLYQIHWPNPDGDIEQAWEEMARLAEEGKVRYLGVSNFSVDQIKRVQKIRAVASLQPPYNMLHREVEGELLGYCAERDIGVIAYSPMERGLLTGKFTQERLAGLALDDHRRRMQDFQEPQFGATLELVDRLRPIAERNGGTLAQLAISWVLRRSEVTAAIVGARRPEQIVETAPAADRDLAPEDIEEIEHLLAKRLERIKGK